MEGNTKKRKDSKKWPNVSFVIATYNSTRTFEKCLSSIKEQDYDAEIEIIVGDGGSTDSTLDIAEKYKAKVINVPEDKQGAEYNKGVAAKRAKHEVLVMIDSDNFLPHKNWLKNMIRPLLNDKEILGCGVLRFHHDKKMSILDRYFTLIGATDPVAFFFNKSGHQSWLYDNFNLRGKLLKDKKKYFVVELDPESMPSLGGNGSVLRRKLLEEARSDPDNFFHIDIHVDLARRGYRKYAFVKDTIVHLTNNNLIPFLKRRKFYVEKYHFEDQSRRRYSIYEPKKDRFRLLLFILYTLSIVFPLIHSFKGYLKRRDVAWFMHPLMCLGILFVYGWPITRKEVKRVILER